MSDWVVVAPAELIKPGDFRLVDVDDITVMVINIEGEFYAIEDICTHDGGTLSDGEIEACEIICPRHGARFDIRTGVVTAPPAYEDLPTYAVRIVDGMVQVRDDRFD